MEISIALAKYFGKALMWYVGQYDKLVPQNMILLNSSLLIRFVDGLRMRCCNFNKWINRIALSSLLMSWPICIALRFTL